jgi:putative ATPase
MEPLAERMRPKNADEFVGQDHLMGLDGILRKSAESGVLPSFILWGPPGVGKTTLAQIIAKMVNKKFISLSAIKTGVAELKEIISDAEKNFFHLKNYPLVFIDEIHRFNKAQQDYLLSAVEKGIITLCGATTENPSFEINNALLSRCRVFKLNPLNKEELMKILYRAINKDIILMQKKIEIKEPEELIRISGGDARKLLNALELVVSVAQSEEIIITNEQVRKIIKENLIQFDKKGDFHYDIISAFIKSVRGSDPDAALYYLARMLAGGEDILFIARRLIILAAEDIGLANPNALLMANACFQSVHQLGMPEARIVLSECTIYLACSPKSNSAYTAIDRALELVEKTGDIPIPLHLRNAPTQLMKELGYGAEYMYPHDFINNYINQLYLPDEIKDEKIYQPGNNSREKEFDQFLNYIKKK